MHRETAYDDVFDAQRHFRSVLDGMARPGKINRLAGPVLSPPQPFLPASATVAFALLNADVTFHLAGFTDAASAYLVAHTHSRPAAAGQADFLFLQGSGTPEVLHEAKLGLPAYPEGGATAVIQVEQIGRSSSVGGLQLSLEGPGIETRESLFVAGLHSGFLDVLKERNREFPLGLDAIFVTPHDSLFCLPRTTRVSWQSV